MKTVMFLTLLMLIGTASAYPNREMPAVFREACPNAVMGKDLVFHDDGNGVYLRYISPKCSIPNTIEAERLWEIVQTKRILESQNQIAKVLLKQDLQDKYQTQIYNLGLVINNSKEIQAKTSWTNAEVIYYIRVMAWHDEVLARSQQLILRTIRYIGLENGWFK